MAKKDIKEKSKKKNSSYFKEMKAELKKVVWPTPKQLVNNTVTVIAFVLIIAVIVFVLDVCFDAINEYGIVKLQQSVQSAFGNDETSDDETNSTEDSSSKENSEDENVVESDVIDSNIVDGNSEEQTEGNEETTTDTETQSSEESSENQTESNE